MSSELQKKTDLNTELQSFVCYWLCNVDFQCLMLFCVVGFIFIMLDCILQSDKDLVQEVTRLRRSLDDAECLSLETKKEWAFLRSENISLKERDVSRGERWER